MSETPPFANYPRTAAAYGSSAALQSLSDGYFGLSKVFGINIVIVVATNLAARSGSVPLGILALILLAISVTIGFLTYGPNKKIGEGAGWSPAQPVIASVLMGINSALCCGVIGYSVMQSIATNHMKRYGVKGGMFGLKKGDVQGFVRDLEAREQSGRIA